MGLAGAVLCSGQFLAMPFSALQQAIIYAGPGLEAYLVGVVFWRRLFRVLPLFSIYVCFVLAYSLGMWVVRGNPNLYYWTYWIGQLIALVLTFLIILELYTRLFEAYPAIRSLTQSVLLLVLGILILSSIILTRTDPHWMRRWLVLFERSLRFIQVGLLCLFFFVVYYLRLRLDARVRAVGIGFSIYVTAELANFALVAYFYHAYERAWDLFTVTAYLATLAVWAISLTVRVPEIAPPAISFPVQVLVEMEAAIRKRMEEINRALWAVFRGRLF